MSSAVPWTWRTATGAPGAVGGVGERLPGEADDPATVGVGARHPIAHEPAVGVADEVDAFRVDGERCLDLP